jgi:hypothetical protein
MDSRCTRPRAYEGRARIVRYRAARRAAAHRTGRAASSAGRRSVTRTDVTAAGQTRRRRAERERGAGRGVERSAPCARSARRSPPPGRSSDGPAGDRSGETPRQACPKAPRGRVLPGESGLFNLRSPEGESVISPPWRMPRYQFAIRGSYPLSPSPRTTRSRGLEAPRAGSSSRPCASLDDFLDRREPCLLGSRSIGQRGRARNRIVSQEQDVGWPIIDSSARLVGVVS